MAKKSKYPEVDEDGIPRKFWEMHDEARKRDTRKSM